MDKLTPNNGPNRRQQEAQIYTEEQIRLLLAMRDMVKWEVQRQLSSIINQLHI